MNNYLEISNLTKRFGQVCALQDVSLKIGMGDVLALLGPNGAGKSTLFGCLLGLLRPSSGRILAEGNSLQEMRIGYLPERVALYPQRSVWENASFFARLKGYSLKDMAEELARTGLAEVRERAVRKLSKGMLQRLGLAIALCGQPELLILDEPFNGLDPVLLDTLQSILRQENERGATLLISTHTMSAVESLATHAAILLSGRLAAFNSLDNLRAQFGGWQSLEQIYHQIARANQNVFREEVLS